MLLPSLLLSVAAALPATPAEIAPVFVEVLRKDDLIAAIEQLSAEKPEWRALTEIVDEYQCVSVPSFTSTVTVDGSKAQVIVNLTGTAHTLGRGQQRVELPREWVLDAVETKEGWRLQSVQTRERVAAREIVAAGEPRRRELFDRHLQTLDYETLIWNLCELGRANRERGESVLNFVVAFTREVGDRKLEALSLFALATWKRYVPDPEGMQRYADEAMAAARASGDPEAMVVGHFAVAAAAGQRGDLQKSLEGMLAAAALVDAVEDPRLAVGAMHNVAATELQRGNLIEALRIAQPELDIARRFNLPHAEMLAMLALGMVHAELRNNETALHIHRGLLRLARRLRNRGIEATTLANMGIDMMVTGDPNGGVAAIEQAIALEKQSAKPSDLIESYVMLGEALVAAGRYAEAEKALERARPAEDASERFPKREASRLSAHSEAKLRQGDGVAALALAREALAIDEKGLDIAGDAVSHAPWRSRAAEARALRALGRRQEAEASYRQAIAKVESVRRSFVAPEGASWSFMAGKTDVHRELAELLVEGGRAGEALELTSAVKARTLLEAVQYGRIDPFEGITEEERAQYDRIGEQIEKLNVELLRAAPADRESIHRRLIAARTELETYELALFARHRPLRVTAAQRPPTDTASLAEEGTAIVEYLIGEESTLAFVITRGAPVVAMKIAAGRADLQDRVARYMKKIERRDLTHGTDALALYRLLVEPLEHHVAGAEVLCIVPDGALWRVPFQALKTPAGRYLIEQRAIFYAPSLGALQLANSRPRTRMPESIVAVGNPAVAAGTRSAMRALMRDVPLGDLPDAEEEARKVGKMYERARVFTGRDAREEKVKEAAAAADVLHFATHALVNDSQPMYSSIVLAGGDTAEDGLLEAREILGSDLHADLVVLSACSTARGEISPGEGLVGLTWSFLIAGASSTVAAQWPVLSKSTADLMVEFHRKLTGTNAVGKAEALRQAQLTIMRRRGYEHPFYWSPFVLVGAN